MEAVEKFEQWFRKAKPRDRYTYHTGYLPADRVHMVQVPVIKGMTSWFAVNKGPVNVLAEVVYRTAKAGFVHLLQRRLEEGRYEYIAERR